MTASETSSKSKDGERRPGVLLFHGLCGSPAELRYVANALSREGYVVHCPVLSGHGGTTADLARSTWLEWVESARAAFAELASRTDEIIVGGLSTGSLLALLLAAENTEKVRGLALYSPTFWVNGRKVPWSLRIARTCLAFRPIARLFNLPSPENYGIKDERMRELVKRSMSGSAVLSGGTPAITALERRHLVRKVLPLLGTIRQPALIVHPREDCLADLDNAFHLQRNLAGPTELVVLDDSYHLVTIDRQRQRVVDATQRFLSGLTSQSAPRATATETSRLARKATSAA